MTETNEEHLAWLLAASAEADRGEWGEDLTGLTPQQMVALLVAKGRE